MPTGELLELEHPRLTLTSEGPLGPAASRFALKLDTTIRIDDGRGSTFEDKTDEEVADGTEKNTTQTTKKT